jgi:hypothetical protein
MKTPGRNRSLLVLGTVAPLIVAMLAVMAIPAPASAGMRDRIRRRDDRETASAAARVAPPPAGVRYRAFWKGWTEYASPRQWDDWAYDAPLRARAYYRRNGLPAPAASRGTTATVARNQPAVPRNFVERSDATAEPLPALHEPTLAAGADGQVEPASATEPLPGPAAPPSAEVRNQWPEVRRAENEQWREQRIEELERRLDAVEAAQRSAGPVFPEPAGN